MLLQSYLYSVVGPVLPWAYDKVDFLSMFLNLRQDFQGALMFHNSEVSGIMKNDPLIKKRFSQGRADDAVSRKL